MVFAGSLVGLMVLPINFPYWAFAVLIAANGIGSGMFAAPNTSSIMSCVPAKYRGVASGMRSTFQNSGTAVSTGVFFSIMIAGLASTLPKALTSGLVHQGVSITRLCKSATCRRPPHCSRPCSASTRCSTRCNRPGLRCHRSRRPNNS